MIYTQEELDNLSLSERFLSLFQGAKDFSEIVKEATKICTFTSSENTSRDLDELYSIAQGKHKIFTLFNGLTIDLNKLKNLSLKATNLSIQTNKDEEFFI